MARIPALEKRIQREDQFLKDANAFAAQLHNTYVDKKDEIDSAARIHKKALEDHIHDLKKRKREKERKQAYNNIRSAVNTAVAGISLDEDHDYSKLAGALQKLIGDKQKINQDIDAFKKEYQKSSQHCKPSRTWKVVLKRSISGYSQPRTMPC